MADFADYLTSVVSEQPRQDFVTRDPATAPAPSAPPISMAPLEISGKSRPRIDARFKTDPTGKTTAGITDDKNRFDLYSSLSNFKGEGLDMDLMFDQVDDDVEKQKIRKLAEIQRIKNQAANNMKGVEAQVNLRPLASLVDAWTGSNFSSFYPTPKYFDEKMEETKALGTQAGKLQGDIEKLDYESAKFKIEKAIEVQKAKSNADRGALQVLMQGRGMQIKEDSIADQLVAALAKANAQKQQQLKPLGDKQIERLEMLTRIHDQFENIYKFVRDNKKSVGTKNVLLANDFTRKGAEYFMPEAGELNALIKSASQELSYAKERGVLRRDDVPRYEVMLAQVYNEPELFLGKMRNSIQEIRDTYRNTISTYDSLGRQTGIMPKQINGVIRDQTTLQKNEIAQKNKAAKKAQEEKAAASVPKSVFNGRDISKFSTWPKAEQDAYIKGL